MKDFYQQIMEEHPDVDKKDLSRFLKSFTSPDIEINSDFSSSLKRKLFHIIRQEDENNYLEQLKLIPFKVKFRYHLGGFAVAMFAFLFVFVVVFFTDFFSNQLLVPSKYVEVESIKIEKGEGVKGADEDGVAIRTMFADAVLLMNNTQEEESYLYDGKKYPKVATEMPIYRHSGSLMNEGILTRYVEGTKFGGISLKGWADMKITSLTMNGRESDDPGPTTIVDVDLKFGKMNILNLPVPSLSLRDAKSFVKDTEKVLKRLKISLSAYGPAERKGDGVLFYPFLIHGKYRVWDAENNQPQGMWVVYETPTATLSLREINIAKYTYANHPTLSQKEILKDFSVGMKMLTAPEVVCIVKEIGDEVYYLPGLRFAIDEEKAIYKELVDF